MSPVAVFGQSLLIRTLVNSLLPSLSFRLSSAELYSLEVSVFLRRYWVLNLSFRCYSFHSLSMTFMPDLPSHFVSAPIEFMMQIFALIEISDGKNEWVSSNSCEICRWAPYHFPLFFCHHGGPIIYLLLTLYTILLISPSSVILPYWCSCFIVNSIFLVIIVEFFFFFFCSFSSTLRKLES